jgi:hypothetical protein
MSGLDDLWGVGPGPKTTRRKKRGRPEAKVQAQIVAWLLSKGAIVAITDAGSLAKLGLGISTGVPTGWPDITACLPGGRFLGVECKAPEGRQSTAQIKFQVMIEKRGGLYVLAHSVVELVAKLRACENIANPCGFCID